MSGGFVGFARSVGNKEITVPQIRLALYDPDFKGFTVKVDGWENRAPDGWFHPSTHPLLPERVLWFYMRNPDDMIPEVFDPTSTLAVTAGTFFHEFAQTVLVANGLLLRTGPCPCGCDTTVEEYHEHEATRARGHSDGVWADGSGWEFKGLDVDTPVLTTSGWTTMIGLKAGDEVFAPDGQATKVLAAHTPRLGQPCYRLTFADGQEIVADDEHLWSVDECVSHNRIVSRVASTQEMAESSLRNGDRYRFRFAIPNAPQTAFADLPIDPWLLGAWLGDGISREGVLSAGPEDLDYMTSRVVDAGERVNVWQEKNRTVSRLQVYGLRGRLDRLGILGAGQKRIPEMYLTASEDQRRALLAGILDTDGSVSRHQVVVTMKSKDLMEDVLSLVRSLGIKASMRPHRASLNGQDAGEVWTVQFLSVGQHVFAMPRKQAKEGGEAAHRQRMNYNALIGIEPVVSRPTRCITVAHESSTYLAGRGFLPTHNTMNPDKMRGIPKGEPDDPAVLAWFMERCPEYYAQQQEYMRLGGRRRVYVTIIGMTYPFEMREIWVDYDPFYASRVATKYERVLTMVANDEMPMACCAPRSKQAKVCPARGVCPVGMI